VEKQAELGSGMPYSKQMTIPEHIVNIAGGCTQITATYIPMSEQSDFIIWLQSLTKEYRTSIGLKDYKDPAEWIHLPFPRVVVGLYLQNRFRQFVKLLRSKGFEVDVRNLTTATSIKPVSGGLNYEYEIELNYKTTILSSIVFIASGHWNFNRYPQFQSWVPSPYPPQVIQKECKQKHNIGILGCSLSAFDAVLSLSKVMGKFKPIIDAYGKQRLEFLANPKSLDFKLVMYGRKAILPQVMGVVVNKIFSYQYLKPEVFIPIISRNDGFLPLDDLWILLKREIFDEVAHLHSSFPDNWETITLEEAVSKLNHYLSKVNYMDRLEKELDEANASLVDGIPLLLQNIFYQSYAIFDEVLSYFTAEDRIRFQQVKTELHLLIAPFPAQNAEKLLALMKGGYLKIQKLGQKYTISEIIETKKLRVSWNNGSSDYSENVHDLMVGATGQSADFDKDQSAITKSLKKYKLLQEILIPFRLKSNGDKYSNHTHVVRRDDQYYFRPDGALIDIRNFSLVPANKKNSDSLIYYMGPYTSGQIAFPQDMSVVTTAAERAVTDILKKGILTKDNSIIHDVDPSPMYGWVLNAKGDLNAQMKQMSADLKVES